MRSVDDLSYFYLDCSISSTARCHVVGVSIGAWIAAEIAVKSTARLSRLVMANAVGVRSPMRETRDIVDIFALTEDEYVELVYCESQCRQRDYKACRCRVLAAARAASDGADCLESVFPNPR